MFTKKVEYSSKDVEKEYKKIENSHEIIKKIISSLTKDKNKCFIYGINNNEKYINIMSKTNDKVYVIIIDLEKRRVYLGQEDYDYMIVYRDYPDSEFIPIGHRYEFRNIIITKKLPFNFNKNTRLTYELSVNDNDYTIVINDKNNLLDEKEFINIILDQSNIKSIRDLFILMTQVLDVSKYDVNIKDIYDNHVVIENNQLTKYIEYQDDNKNQIVYLANNRFLIEKRTKEEYQDEIISYVKKIGVYDGKEKR